MPPYSTEIGLLSLCFVDPFRADLPFDVVRQLSQFKMDFLIVLPLGFDIRRNLAHYLDETIDDRIADLIGDPNWRQEWQRSDRPQREFIRFLLQRFDHAMETLDYKGRDLRDTFDVKVKGMAVFLYALAFYSRHQKGLDFWKTTLSGTDPQYRLGI
jgi:three-Cys-motif partner protein